MNLVLGASRRVMVDQSTVIGSGGEAVIHRDPDHPNSRAIKVYHQPSVPRAQKLGTFINSGIKFPAEVIAPLELASDARQVVGFGMRLLSRRWKKLSDVFTPSFCQDHGITTRTVAEMFLPVGRNLSEIHPRGFYVGDLNDGAIMFHEENFDVAWVDVDSWGTPGFPCIVGTQLYLSPDLYNIDLSKGAYFKPEHDWYAFSVLLFRALLRKHPFKAGMHAQYKSVLERAAHGVTVLDSSVTYPSGGLQPGVLGDELADLLLKYLKRKHKSPFPLDKLEEYRDSLVNCASCGVWYPHTQARCPQCAEVTVAPAAGLGAAVELLIEVKGRILYLQLDGSTVLCVAEEAGKLVIYRKEENSNVQRLSVSVSHSATMRFGFSKNLFVICDDSNVDEDSAAIYLFDLTATEIQPLKQLTTGILAGQAPVFGVSRRFVYRTAKNMLLRTERFGAKDTLERPVTQIQEGQCLFFVDPNPSQNEVVFGVNRDMSILRWFLSVGNSDGTTYNTRDVALPSLDTSESMLDVSVRFASDAVLVIRKTRKRGKDRVRLATVDVSSAQVTWSETRDVIANPQWDNIHGKAFAHGRVIHPTDQGLLMEVLSTGATTVLKGTASTVSPDDFLWPFGNGVLAQRFNAAQVIHP